ncbi:MAG: Galactokinase [Marmoricola sp.]|nr:Galactokinase [Marmoricola sp.]
MALTQCTTARLTLREDDRLLVTSGSRSWEGTVGALDGADSWVLYVAGVLVALDVKQGMEIEISSDVPIGAGLSSSAALECSVAVAVDAALGLGLSPEQLVEAGVRAESETVGAPTGGLDQAIAVHARADHALLVDFAAGTREQVPFDPAAKGLAVLVIDTLVSHELTDGGYESRRDDAWAAAEALGLDKRALAQATSLEGLAGAQLRRARHVLSEVARVDEFVAALTADDWGALGPLMDASHDSLRDDYEVSCEELDVAVETARRAGALGSRMTGGGFGGSAIALVPVERVSAVQEAVAAAFVDHGWREPDFFVAAPGPGARLG